MAIALRCDGDDATGAGHVARCLQLAHAFRRAGRAVTFVGTYGGVAERLLDDAGIERRPPSSGPAGLPAEIDAAVVDVYATSDDELARASRERPVVAFRDARGGAAALGAAIALDYHLDAEVGAARTLAGPDFAPIDPALTVARRDVRVGPWLIALGGSTAGRGALPTLVEAALAAGEADVAVAGAVAAPAHPRVRGLGARAGLTDAIGQAAVLICGAGVTAYEAACAGIPTLLVVLAANQERVADAFSALAPVLDGREPIAAERAQAALARLSDAPIAHVGPTLVDGLGAQRVRDALLASCAGDPLPAIQRYRPATLADGPVLLEWRNDSSVRAVSGTTHAISASEHAAWLTRTLADPSRTLLVVERGGEPVGTVRFDRDGDRAEISITVAPDQRGHGIGVQAIRETTEHELATRRELGRVVARVGDANAASQRAFERAGYRPTASAGAWLVLESLR